MSVAITRRGGFFVLRHGKGAQNLGLDWPTGAIASLRVGGDSRAIVVEDDGSARIVHGSTYDALEGAREAIETKRARRLAIGRAVGKFGEANLYERVALVEPLEEAGRGEVGPFVIPARDAKTKTVHAKIRKATGSMIEGFASTPSVDRDYDVVEPSAFEESITAFKQNPVLLWMHDARRPIGRVEEIEVQKAGLFVRASVEDAQIREWVAKDLVRMFSVQFIIKDYEIQEPAADVPPDRWTPSIRIIKKAELLEVSIVTIPANRDAAFNVVKSIAAGSDLSCRCCREPADFCRCSELASVVPFRRFAVAGAGKDYSAGTLEVARALGDEAARLAKTIDADGKPSYRHHGVADGELVLVPELLRLAMARLVAVGADELEEAELKAAHGHLARHYEEDLREPVPELGKGPEPHRFAEIAFPGLRPEAVVFSSGLVDEKAAHDWLAARGFRGGARLLSSGDEVALWYGPTRRSAELRRLPLDEGVSALFTRSPKSGAGGQNLNVKKSDDPETPTAPVEPKPAETPAPTDPGAAPKPAAAAQPAPTEPKAEDDSVELDASTLTTAERLASGDVAGLSPEAVESAIADLEAAVEE